MRRRIEITAFEQERIVVQGILTHCPLCGSHSELLTVAQAAALAQVEADNIDQWLVEGKTHGATTPGDDRRVCRNSLLRFKQS